MRRIRGLLMGLLRQNQPRRGRRYAVCASIQWRYLWAAVCASGRRDRLRGQHRKFIRNHLHFELYLEITELTRIRISGRIYSASIWKGRFNMTIKQAFIGIVTAIALVIAVLISQIVRINTMTGDLREAQTRIETLETKAAATPKPTATREPSTEPTATRAGGLRGEPGQRVQRV